MRTGQQKRIQERGKVMINFEIEPEWDERINKVAAAEERSKSALIRYVIKEYVVRKEIEKKI